ncbi:MAG: hypothetical protein ACK4WD_08815 [Flavobacteriales bacterium]
MMLSIVKDYLKLWICSYFFLLVFPFPLDMIIPTEAIAHRFDPLSKIVGQIFFGLENVLRPEMTGSGDTQMDWLNVVSIALLSTLISIILIFIGYVRRNIDSILNFIRIYLRFYLGLFLIFYGIAKLYVNGQFGQIELYHLDSTFGNKSPMGLLWTFMAYSREYTLFIGVMETLAGVLLLYKRSSLIGGLMGFAVMLNVFLLNMFYDVPVKIFSFHLLLCAFIIISPSIKKLLLFLTGQNPQPVALSFIDFGNKSVAIVFTVLKTILVVVLVGLDFFSFNEDMEQPADYLNGVFRIESIEYSNDSIPALKWEKILINSLYGSVTDYSGTRNQLELEIDTTKKLVNFNFRLDSTSMSFNYELYASDSVKFTNIQEADTIRIFTKRLQKDDFLLMNRGFHWVSEYPLNR